MNEGTCTLRGWRRLGLQLAVLLLFFVTMLFAGAVIGQVARATDVATGTGSSCVAAVEGHSTTTPLTINTARVVYMKCYYSEGGLTWLTGTNFPASGACVSGAHTVTVSSQDNLEVPQPLGFSTSCPTSGTYLGSFAIDRVETGYLEFHFTLKQANSSSWQRIIVGETRAHVSVASVGSIGASLTGQSPTVNNYPHSGRYVLWSEFEDAEPPYRWGPPIVNAVCEQYTVSGPLGTDVFEPGQTVPITVATVAGADPVLIDIQWRPGEPVAFKSGLLSSGTGPQGLIHNGTAGLIGTSWTYNVVVPDGPPVTMSSVAVSCWRDGEGQLWTGWGDDGWEATEGATRACGRAVLIWPEQRRVSVGDDVVFTVVKSGIPTGDDGILVEYITFDFDNDPVPSFDSATWIEVPEWTSTTMHAAINVTLDAVFEGPLNQFIFRCTDSQGTTYRGNWSPGQGLQTSASAVAEQDCYDDAGLGAHPKTWIPGLLKGIACLGKTLVVPSSGDIDAITDAGSEVSDKAPISYVVAVGGEMSGMLAGAPAAVDAGRDGCLVVLGPMEEVGIEEAQTACPAALDGTNVSTARSVMGAGSWVLIALSFWGATRKIVGK